MLPNELFGFTCHTSLMLRSEHFRVTRHLLLMLRNNFFSFAACHCDVCNEFFLVLATPSMLRSELCWVRCQRWVEQELSHRGDGSNMTVQGAQLSLMPLGNLMSSFILGKVRGSEVTKIEVKPRP